MSEPPFPEAEREPTFSTRHVVLYAIVWVVLAVGVAVLLGSLNLRDYMALARHGVATRGTVLKLEPEVHQTVRYSYRVDGVIHEGKGTVGRGNPCFCDLTAGDRILVYYDAGDPRISVMGEPAPRLENELISVGAAALLFPSFLVLAMAFKRVSRRD
jgi:hypothetical protein